MVGFNLFWLYVLCLKYLLFSALPSYAWLEALQPLVVGSEHVSSKSVLTSNVETRILRAAQPRTSLKARSQEIIGHNLDLHYIEDSQHGARSQFAAQVKVTVNKPALVLEEIEDQLDHIYCDDSRIELAFTSSQHLEHTYTEIAGLSSLILITSHEGCNSDGERNAYDVSKTSVEVESRKISFSVSHLQWHQAAHSMKVDFGSSDVLYQVRRHKELSNRALSTDVPAFTATATGGTDSTTIPFPLPSTSAPTPRRHDAHGDIGHQFLNQAILPPDLTGANGLTLHGPTIPLGFTVGCKNCTTTGTIDLIQGSFTMGTINGTSNTTMGIIDFFEHGFVELLVNDFSAHIELETKLQPSKNLNLYQAPLPDIGLSPFQIPGIAVVGLIFKPSITVGFQLEAEFDFTYGFDFKVPNNSSVIVDIGNVTNSSVTGFQDTTITAIPFQAEVDSVSLSLSSAFTPELLLGISVFGGKGTAGAGIFFNLPAVVATVSQVTHVNSTCEPVTNSSTGSTTLDAIFGSLTNIVPQVEFDLGLVAQADVRAGPLNFNVTAKHTALSRHLTLPTACISYNAKEKAFATPTTTSSKSSVKNSSGTSLKVAGGYKGIMQATILILAYLFDWFVGI